MVRRTAALLLALVVALGVGMAVVQELLQRRIELYLNSAWVDVSDRLLTQTLSPNPGRTSGGNRVSASTLAFDLDNPTGDLTPFNAESSYYPHVDVGMLVRYSVHWDGNWYVRGVFEATEVEPHWPFGDLSNGTTSGQPGESYVSISAADILQRLIDDEQPFRSAMYRSTIGVRVDDIAPLAYWPMEDGADATQFASALPGQAGQLRSWADGESVDLAADATMPGSEPLPTFPADTLVEFQIPDYTDTGQWVIQVAMRLQESNSIGGLFIYVGGLYIFMDYSATTLNVGGANLSTGASIFTVSTPVTADVVGEWISVVVASIDTGGGDVLLVNLLNDQAESVATTLSLNPGVYGKPRRVQMGSGVNSIGGGHFAFFTDPNFDTSTGPVEGARAMSGWAGETAGRRLERLTFEEGIEFTSSGDLDATAPMGPQPIGTFIGALRDCEDTDLGILHAQREANGVHYRTRVDLYNQAPALTLDAAQSELANPFRPSATSKYVINDVTVSRPNGSSARATDAESIAKYGRRAREYNANTETDDQVADVAGWLLHLGTPDGMYCPSLTTELTIATQNIEDWLTLDLGDRVQVINLPPQYPAGTVDLLVDGYTEPRSPSRWTPRINCSPASPWTVAELDDTVIGKLDTAGTVMHIAATSGATSLTVHVEELPRWTTSGGEMPIPILVSGQVNSVTAISNVSPAFVAAGTVAHANNASVTPSMPAGVQAGDLLLVLAAIRNSGTGTVSTPAGYTALLTSGNMTLLGKVHTGSEVAPTVTFSGGVANADTSAQMAAFRGVSMTVHASGAQLNGSAQNITYPALDVSRANCAVLYLGWKQDDWTSVASPGTEIGEPDTTTGDDQGIVWAYTLHTTATAITSGSFTVTGGVSAISRGAVVALASDIQTMTVTRGTNGVTKALAAGDQVNVYQPARLAL